MGLFYFFSNISLLVCRNATDFLNGFYLSIFREKGREGEREGDEHQCVVASHVTPTGDLAHNPGICPD